MHQGEIIMALVPERCGMAKEETKEVKVTKTESKIIEGFKFGFGLYVAFLTGTVILGLLTAAIWFIMLATR
jgi:hypothetical protein